MSVEANRAGLLGLIYDFRHRAFATTRQEREGKMPWVIDLADVEQLTLDAALVLTAEYHRRVILYPGFHPIINDRDWSPEVRGLLEELGFYYLVRAGGRTGTEAVGPDRSLRFVPFISGTKVDRAVARQLIDALRDAAGQEPEREFIYAALVEAIINVKHHAYPDAIGQIRVPSVSRWWAAGAYDPEEQTLQFVMYDQGVGIPATLPKRSFFKSVLRFCPVEWSDADVIAGGVRYGRSRFRSTNRGIGRSGDDEGRGNGLWTICHFISQLGGSFVRIASGRGEVTYSGGRAVEKKNFDNPFCGTLIQWSLKLPRTHPPIAEAGA